MRSEQRNIMWSRLLRLSHDSGVSLQQQIREGIVRAILDGRLRPDTLLPSSRELARQLNVARNTVMLAYEHLVDARYLLPQERVGYFVNPDMVPEPVVADDQRHSAAVPPNAPDWHRRLVIQPAGQRNIRKPIDWQQFHYPFIYGQVDPALFPLKALRECFRQASSVQAATSLARDFLDADDAELIEEIQSKILPRRGVWTDAGNILITLGAQNALHILAELLLDARSTIGIEEPGYPDARNIFGLRTSRLAPLPVDEHGLVVGPHLSELDYVFVTPSHQSPTTVTMPLERRHELLALARRHDFIILEDDYESELNFVGAPTPALKSLDEDDRVLYLGSLSKTVDPGMRLGFLVAPEGLTQEARALRRLMLRHPPANNQHAIALFLSLGHHDTLIERVRRVHRERWEAMGEALERHLPDSTRTPTFGGSSFWVHTPEHIDTRVLADHAAREGIFFEPGDVNFLTDPPPKHFLRLGLSVIPTERIEPGIQRLANLVHRLA
jgi:GntR family transcriptional regulator/MocR family aminotransferase